MQDRKALICCSLLLMCLAAPAVAQTNQDNQPHITPRKSLPEPTPKPTPKVQEDQPVLQDTQQPLAAESSSKDSQVDFDAAPLSKQPGPTKEPEEGVFHPWDPHRAAKDVEVGNYYLRLKNYRAALERFNDALLYKPRDADATFGLAVTQEKLDLLSQAYKSCEEYLKILDAGPHAKECREAMKRIEPHLDAHKDSSQEVKHDIEVGETYLSMNNFQSANERFQEALLLDPDNPLACYRMAQSLRGLRQLDSARRFYQKYLDLAPKGPFAGDARKAISDITAASK